MLCAVIFARRRDEIASARCLQQIHRRSNSAPAGFAGLPPDHVPPTARRTTPELTSSRPRRGVGSSLEQNLGGILAETALRGRSRTARPASTPFSGNQRRLRRPGSPCLGALMPMKGSGHFALARQLDPYDAGHRHPRAHAWKHPRDGEKRGRGARRWFADAARQSRSSASRRSLPKRLRSDVDALIVS